EPPEYRWPSLTCKGAPPPRYAAPPAPPAPSALALGSSLGQALVLEPDVLGAELERGAPVPVVLLDAEGELQRPPAPDALERYLQPVAEAEPDDGERRPAAALRHAELEVPPVVADGVGRTDDAEVAAPEERVGVIRPVGARSEERRVGEKGGAGAA